jgi:hypothetical protein
MMAVSRQFEFRVLADFIGVSVAELQVGASFWISKFMIPNSSWLHGRALQGIPHMGSCKVLCVTYFWYYISCIP